MFIVPSIWSAVILIKQNNFEENATAFVESSKAYGRSIIYDYKIDHSEGSTVELFFTRAALNDNMKAVIFSNAAEYGIDSSQVIINDHSSTEGSNNLELVKGIYDKMDTEIGKTDERIRQQQDELKAAKGTDIPYVQLTKEISSAFPAIREVYMAQGAGVTADSLSMKQSVIVLVKADTLLDEESRNRLDQWLKVRLDTENLTLLMQE